MGGVGALLLSASYKAFFGLLKWRCCIADARHFQFFLRGHR